MLPHSRLILLLLGLLGASATLLAAERSTRPAPVTPIPSLDVPRYMGAWYEIAKFPNRFQRQCAGYTTAHYSLQPDKTVQVITVAAARTAPSTKRWARRASWAGRRRRR